MKLVIFLRDVHKGRTREKETSTKIEEKMMEETTKTKENSHDDDEVVYVAMKDEFDEDEEIALMTCVNKNDKWIINIGCSHHMTRDKSKFITLNSYNGNSVRFGNDAPYLIKGKGSIRLIDKIMCVM